MYVYVVKFENYPNLIKIGKSVVPDSRVSTLSRQHGNVIHSEFYLVGKGCFQVESILHREYSDYQSTEVRGDGSTEFFSDLVIDEVKKRLSHFQKQYTINFPEESLRKELKEEQNRYLNLISKLLGYKYSGSYPDNSVLPVGWNDIERINSCIYMGYPQEDVYTKFVINGLKDCPVLTRFTTEKRVAFAHHLHLFGSRKSQSLEKLIESLKQT